MNLDLSDGLRKYLYDAATPLRFKMGLLFTKITMCQFLRDSKSRRASKLLHWVILVNRGVLPIGGVASGRLVFILMVLVIFKVHTWNCQIIVT